MAHNACVGVDAGFDARVDIGLRLVSSCYLRVSYAYFTSRLVAVVKTRVTEHTNRLIHPYRVHTCFRIVVADPKPTQPL